VLREEEWGPAWRNREREINNGGTKCGGKTRGGLGKGEKLGDEEKSGMGTKRWENSKIDANEQPVEMGGRGEKKGWGRTGGTNQNESNCVGPR